MLSFNDVNASTDVTWFDKLLIEEIAVSVSKPNLLALASCCEFAVVPLSATHLFDYCREVTRHQFLFAG